MYAPRGFRGVFFMKEMYMRRAIELAKMGIGFTNPNPLVGAVIVKDGRIIAEGYHAHYGELHAERNALKNATEDVTGGDMYVTLEPCSHYGKQPPCCEAVVENGIKRVYIGSRDPNPRVSGNGVKYLKEHGVEVIEDFMRDECDEMNDIFFHYITTKTPYVILKTAMTIDGKIASFTGDSKWITNEKSREDVHRTRKRVSSIMVGINTVLQDDPMLNCRLENPKHPIRVICDSRLRIPLDSQIVKTANEIHTIIATVSDDGEKISLLESKGVEIIRTSGERVNLKEFMSILGKRRIDSVLIEGGGELNFSVINEGLVNEINLYIAPKVIGGATAKTPVEGMGIELVRNAQTFKAPEVFTFGDDVMLKYRKVR